MNAVWATLDHFVLIILFLKVHILLRSFDWTLYISTNICTHFIQLNFMISSQLSLTDNSATGSGVSEIIGGVLGAILAIILIIIFLLLVVAIVLKPKRKQASGN